MMKCVNCGQEIPDGKFCPFCGTAQDILAASPSGSDVTDADGESNDVENATVLSSQTQEEERIEKTVETPMKAVEAFAKAADKKKSASNRGLIIAGVAAVVLIALFLIFKKDPVSKYMSLQESGDYAKANDLYETKIAGNIDSEKEVSEYLSETLYDSWNAYINGDGNSDDLDQTLEKLHKIETTEDVKAEIAKIEKSYEAIKNSAKYFSLGQENQAIGEFEKAIREYEYVSKDDPFHYEEAQKAIAEAKEQYVSDMVAEAQGFMDNKQYNDALESLTKALKYTKDDAEIREIMTEATTKDFETNLKEYVSSDQFGKAKNCYESAKNNSYCEISDEMTKLYEGYMEDTKNSYLTASREKYKEEGYLAAIDVITEGLQKFPNDSKLNGYKELFASAEPISLKSLSIMDEHCAFGDIGEQTDKFDNTYADCIGLSTFNVYDTPNRAFAKYLVNKNYTTLSFKVFNAVDSSHSQICARVIADDLKIYESGYFTNQDKTKEVTLSIRDVEALEINANHLKGTGMGYAVFADAVVYRELTDEDFAAIE